MQNSLTTNFKGSKIVRFFHTLSIYLTEKSLRSFLIFFLFFFFLDNGTFHQFNLYSTQLSYVKLREIILHLKYFFCQAYFYWKISWNQFTFEDILFLLSFRKISWNHFSYHKYFHSREALIYRNISWNH